MDQIGLAEDANQVPRHVDDGKRANVVLRQQLDGLGDVGIGTVGHDIADHDIDRTHVAFLRIRRQIADKGPLTASSPSAGSKPTPARCCGSSTIADPTRWLPWFRQHPTTERGWSRPGGRTYRPRR